MQYELAVALAITGTISVLAAIPQLLQLYKVKRSDEFSAFSWTIWLIYQLVALAYTISINKPVYIAINGLWVIFYSVMVGLIFVYRLPSKRKSKTPRNRRNRRTR